MIKNNSGATSVLVIMLMVVLILFGLAALTTSYAGLKLSRKTSEWLKEYYLLEGEAERIVALVDERISNAKKETEAIKDIDALNESFNTKAYKKLLDLSMEIPNIKINNNPLTVTYTVTEKNKEHPKNITVVLSVKQIDNSITIENQANYEIYQWKEWQEQFEFDNEIEFENPQFESDNSIELENPQY